MARVSVAAEARVSASSLVVASSGGRIALQRAFHPLLCLGRKLRGRRLLHVFGKRRGGLAQESQVLGVPLAPATHQKMQAQLEAKAQRQRAIHAVGQDPHHLAARDRQKPGGQAAISAGAE